MSHTLARRTAAAALALPLLLAGCAGDDPVPKMPEPSTAPSSPAQTAAVPTEPTLPAEAEGKGIKAAEAFVRHYIAVVDYSRKTMNPSILRRISTPTCAGCNGFTDLLTQVARNKGQIVGGDQAVQGIRVEQLGLPGMGEAYRATATVKTTEQSINGSGVDGLDGVRQPEKLQYGFVLLRDGSKWRVSEWEIL